MKFKSKVMSKEEFEASLETKHYANKLTFDLPEGIVYRPMIPQVYGSPLELTDMPASIGYRPTKKYIVLDGKQIVTEEFVEKFIIACVRNKKKFRSYKIWCSSLLCKDEECGWDHNS